jgi:hypothetical protein
MFLQGFPWGRKNNLTLICFKEKLVIPGRLQKHDINWYHTTPCHPGINQTEETIGQHLWWPKMQTHVTITMYKYVLNVKETKADRDGLHHGINYVSI